MKALKITILFIIVLSGCSEKYLASREEEFLGGEGLISWKEMHVKAMKQDRESISLNVQIEEYIEVKDSFDVEEVYESDNGSVRGPNTKGYPDIGTGCAIGCVFLYFFFGDMAHEYSRTAEDNKYMLLLGMSGLLFIGKGLAEHVFDFPSIVNYVRVQMDTVCVDKRSLLGEEIRVLVENVNFEKAYYTDKNGNIELGFDEIIPEPMEADSELDIIINYEEMADTVDIKLRQ
jgi:hypothetical protein